MLDRFETMAADTRSALSATKPAGCPDNSDSLQPATITFSVDDVTPAADPLWTSTLQESLEMRSGSRIILMPEGGLPALAAEGYFAREERRLGRNGRPDHAYMPSRAQAVSLPEMIDTAPHPNLDDYPGYTAYLTKLGKTSAMLHSLMQAVHLAFSQHRPLILSPDSIWLTIVQGFGHHVHENAEALRDRIVRHEGKETLVVETGSLDAEHWPQIIEQFSTGIRANSNQVLYENLMCKFSTTTPSIQTAMEIALMDVYERYFDYVLMCVCGIPKITLEGTPADWRLMRERIEVLATYDLEWWTSRLAPILDEFVATAEGRPDRKFWQAIYKPRESYGDEVASGWITDLFPYLGDPPTRHRNKTLEQVRENWILVDPRKEAHRMFGFGVGLKSFPSGLSRAPVKVIEQSSGRETDIDLIGGFAGVGQHTEDCALFPIISWAVAEKIEQKQKPVPPQTWAADSKHAEVPPYAGLMSRAAFLFAKIADKLKRVSPA